MPKRISLVRILMLIIFIAFVAVIGWALMYSSVYLLPKSDSMLNYFFITIMLFMLGLAVPYLMLKFSVHQAHLRNPKEKEVRMKDIPKHYDELKNE